jgi:hypothetical protein
MVEINRLYRLIAQTEAELERLKFAARALVASALQASPSSGSAGSRSEGLPESLLYAGPACVAAGGFLILQKKLGK